MTDRRIYPDDAAEHFKESAGKPYRPSNGTEGEIFMSKWCYGCHFDNFSVKQKDAGEGCRLIVLMMGFNADDKKYPREIQYGSDGQPCCTKFKEPVPRTRRKTLDKRNVVADLL